MLLEYYSGNLYLSYMGHPTSEGVFHSREYLGNTLVVLDDLILRIVLPLRDILYTRMFL